MFEYTIKGVLLTMDDMREIDQHYEAACTAEYLLENYPDIFSEKNFGDPQGTALQCGHDVRRRMRKYDEDECSAISYVMDDFLGELREKISYPIENLLWNLGYDCDLVWEGNSLDFSNLTLRSENGEVYAGASLLEYINQNIADFDEAGLLKGRDDVTAEDLEDYIALCKKHNIPLVRA